jgi:formylmethanofuran dehydrogenase subunit E
VTNEEFESAIINAAKLHGHLGPFLVIGVRMGKIAKEISNTNIRENDKLRAEVKVPLSTPFSCVLDGIQATTSCTIGNRKLRIKNSKKEIAASFTLDSAGTIKMSVKPEIIKKLMNKISEGVSNEELAREIVRMPEDLLFTMVK